MTRAHREPVELERVYAPVAQPALSRGIYLPVGCGPGGTAGRALMDEVGLPLDGWPSVARWISPKRGRVVDIATAHGSVRTAWRAVPPCPRNRATLVAHRSAPSDHRPSQISTFTERPVASPHKTVNMATTML